MAESATLPGWPRALTERLAAAYVGLSISTFRRQVQVPARVLSAGRQGWLRDELDDWLDGRPRAGDVAPPEIVTDAEVRALAARLAAPSRPSRRRADAG